MLPIIFKFRLSDNLFLFDRYFVNIIMSSEAEQNRTSVNEEVNRIFNNTDYKRFKWAFLKYMCEVNRPVTDYELFLTSNLGGYMR